MKQYLVLPCFLIGLVLLYLMGAAGADEFPIGGHVVNEAGESVSNATVVAIESEPRTNTLETIVAQGTTDDEGAFSFSLPKPPEDHISAYFIARHPDYGLAFTWSVMLRWSGTYEDIKLTLPSGGAIQGRVVDANGKPICGALVVPSFRCYTPDGGDPHLPLCRPVISVETAADGSFRIDCLPKTARVLLKVTHPDYGMALVGAPETLDHGQAGVLEPDGDHVSVTMAPAGAIEGRVTLPDGSPAPGVKVTSTLVATEKDPTGRAKGNFLGLAEAETNEDGRYRLEGLPGGNYGIQVSCPDWTAEALEPVEVVAGKALTGQDFKLIKGLSIEGKFVFAESETPVAGATVQVRGGPGETSSHLTWRKVTSGSDGVFAFRQPPGEKPLNLVASVGDVGFVARGEERREVKLEEGKDVTGLVFTVKPWPAFKGRVLGPDGKPLAGAEVTLQRGGVKAAVSKQDGTFALALFRRTPGEYEALLLEARHGDLPGHRGVLAKQFLSETDAEGEIQVLPSGSLEGRVVDMDGEPLPKATISLQQHFRFGNYGRLYPDREITCDEQGRYELPEVASGIQHWVRATASGYGQDRNDSAVVQGGEVLELQDLVLLVADSFLAGTIVNEEGEPVAGVRISVNGQSTGHRSIVSDKEGRYRVENLVDEQIRVYASHHQEGERLRARLTAYVGEEDVEIVLGEEQPNYEEREEARIVDTEAPELTVDSWVSGKPTDLASLKGKTVVLVFWDATKKQSAELPGLVNGLMEEYGDSGVEFVSVHRAGDMPPVRAAVREQGLKCRVAMDKADEEGRKGATCEAYKVRGVPAVFVIDKEGWIRYQDIALPAIDEAIETLLSRGG